MNEEGDDESSNELVRTDRGASGWITSRCPRIYEGDALTEWLPHTHVSTILADVVGPKCAARVSALTSRKRLTLAPVWLGWGLEGFAEKYTMPFSPPRLTDANSNPRAPPPLHSPCSLSLSLFLSLSLSLSFPWFLSRSLSRPLRTHKLRVHPHRVGAEVGIKCCRRDGLASRDREGVKARRKTVSSKR